MAEIITDYPCFFTATILNWQNLLKPDKNKDIIVDSLRFLVNDRRILVQGFVLMINHIHLIWQMRAGIKHSDVQRDLLKYTAQQIKRDLKVNHPLVLDFFKVETSDRRYQFWERNPLSVELWNEKVLQQKLNYIHWNPVRSGLCRLPEEYKYSSALFYETGVDNWGFLSHYAG